MSTTEPIDRIDTTNALIDALPADPQTGRPLPPKTRNRARPAMDGPHGWGWTHYFLLPDDTVVGHKIPGNPTFIAGWATRNLGLGVIHLGQATPDPLTGTFTFEAWPYPIDPPAPQREATLHVVPPWATSSAPCRKFGSA